MAYEIPGFSYTLEASGDLSGDQFACVVIDANGQAAIATAGDQVAGVLQSKPEVAGEVATIVQTGITKMKAGAALATIGTKVASDATGRAVGVASNDYNVGVTMDAVANADEIVTVLLTPGGGQEN